MTALLVWSSQLEVPEGEGQVVVNGRIASAARPGPPALAAESRDGGEPRGGGAGPRAPDGPGPGASTSAAARPSSPDRCGWSREPSPWSPATPWSSGSRGVPASASCSRTRSLPSEHEAPGGGSVEKVAAERRRRVVHPRAGAGRRAGRGHRPQGDRLHRRGQVPEDERLLLAPLPGRQGAGVLPPGDALHLVLRRDDLGRALLLGRPAEAEQGAHRQEDLLLRGRAGRRHRPHARVRAGGGGQRAGVPEQAAHRAPVRHRSRRGLPLVPRRVRRRRGHLHRRDRRRRGRGRGGGRRRGPADDRRRQP